MMQLTDSDFNRLVRFMQENYGINLKQKRLLINSRLSASLQAQGYTSFKKFVDDLLIQQLSSCHVQYPFGSFPKVDR